MTEPNITQLETEDLEWIYRYISEAFERTGQDKLAQDMYKIEISAMDGKGRIQLSRGMETVATAASGKVRVQEGESWEGALTVVAEYRNGDVQQPMSPQGGKRLYQKLRKAGTPEVYLSDAALLVLAMSDLASNRELRKACKTQCRQELEAIALWYKEHMEAGAV